MIRWLLLGVGLTGLVAVIANAETLPLAALDGEQVGAIAIVLAMLALAMTALAVYRDRFARAMRDFALWLCLALGIFAGYSFRHDLSAFAYRMAGELTPPGQGVVVEPGEGGERAVRIRRRRDGHFVARAEINGARVTMLVDTGATTVVLKSTDAQSAGIDMRSLAFSVPVQTANGTTYAAPVKLRGIAVGPIMVPQVEALVAKPGTLKESLLGISFLRRLRSYEFAGDFLTLRI